MFKNLFKKSNTVEKIEESSYLIAPVEGKIINIEEVEDEMFSSKALGDGVAIEPEGEIIMAPANCKVISASEKMKHAIGLQLFNDMEILIHIGINTVAMNGDGFELLIKEGAVVKEGTPLVRFNKEKILGNGYKTTVLMIVTNLAECENLSYVREGTSCSEKELISWS
ncbi:PTS sugar transporter subunit IIA [Clostridium nigeriense]|uniref:PTS sugar transporter subunit IIA n=1 Tax=Clostridium nigeriense TaxID=1805470 RepID=UPI003D34A9BB